MKQLKHLSVILLDVMAAKHVTDLKSSICERLHENSWTAHHETLQTSSTTVQLQFPCLLTVDPVSSFQTSKPNVCVLLWTDCSVSCQQSASKENVWMCWFQVLLKFCLSFHTLRGKKEVTSVILPLFSFQANRLHVWRTVRRRTKHLSCILKEALRRNLSWLSFRRDVHWIFVPFVQRWAIKKATR